jgi:predicted CXXCH cytochrome family protein
VAAGQCDACHGDATKPVALKQAGAALCRECHAKTVSTMLERSRLHLPFAEGACLACHDPHGSRESGLLRADMVTTCGACHEDTIAEQRASLVRHAPMKSGRCTLCHEAHAADLPLLFTASTQYRLCRGCHSGEGHPHQLSAPQHPRNANVPMTCVSCHLPHGAANDHLLPVPKKEQLCIRCHVSRVR